MQIYSIHVKYNNRIFPVAYGLLSRKDTSTYEISFQQLKSLVAKHYIGTSSLSPKIIMIDFELSMIKAIENEFANTEISGCYFHLKQNIIRQIQKFGLKGKYETVPEFALWVKMIGALAFVPVDEVRPVFQKLSNCKRFPVDAKPVLNYFEKTYVDIFYKNRWNSQFSLQIWNLYNRTKNCQERTNNTVEGWHNSLKQHFPHKHPHIYKFIDSLKSIQRLNDYNLSQSLANPVTKKNKNNLQKIVLTYNSDCDKLKYLKSIALNYEF